MKKRVNSSKKIILIFFVLFLIWILLQFLAPLALPSNSVKDLSGLTAVSNNEEIISKMPQPWGLMYSAGDRLCHQKAERSFFINGNQMPFCTRCTAIWLGIAIGIGVMVFYKIELDKKFLMLIILGILPIGIDGIGQLLGLWESSNSIRFATGLMIGLICGIAIGIIVDEFRKIISNRVKKSK